MMAREEAHLEGTMAWEETYPQSMLAKEEAHLKKVITFLYGLKSYANRKTATQPLKSGMTMVTTGHTPHLLSFPNISSSW
jgi:hypothetical protein